MFIYNVTINITHDVHEDWLDWMKHVHIPDVLKTGCFIEAKIHEVMYVEDEGKTYSVQYKFQSIEDIEKYQKDFAPGLQKEHSERYKDKYATFRTLLRQVD
ncbi:MAG: DUF4286 family protein [Sphingobacteriaceae bacterium]|nr:DUF4286 family protein [Sphingobacteriaceae bacterium]